MSLKEALSYLNYCIKEGTGYDPEQFVGWSDERLIKFAEEEMNKAEMEADRVRKGEA